MSQENENETILPEKSTTALSLPNKSLALLYNILNVPLHGAQLRARNQFARLIKDQLEVLFQEKIKMCESYATKDDEGKFVMKNAGTDDEQYDLTAENIEKYKKEFEAYMNEVWVVDLLPSLKPAVIQCRPLVLETRIDLGTVDGYVYEDICKAFEVL